MEKPLYILDGGMGKYLIKLGVPTTKKKLWALKSIIDPQFHDLVIKAHFEYFCAGSNVITTNNYTITPRYLNQIDALSDLEKLTKCCVTLAKRARDKYIQFGTNQSQHPLWIVGSIPPLMKTYRADLRLNRNESILYFTQIVSALYDDGHGVDILMPETMSCIEEVLWILEAIHSLRIRKLVWISWSLNDSGDLRSGESVNDAIQIVINTVMTRFENKLNLQMILFNCCLPEVVEEAMENIVKKEELMKLLRSEEIRIGIYPNLMYSIDGHQDYKDKNGGWNVGTVRKDMTPRIYYERFVRKWMDRKDFRDIIGVLGGCCGFEPHHIQFMAQQLRAKFPQSFVRRKIKSKL